MAPAALEGIKLGIAVVQLLNAVATLGGNVMLAGQEVENLLQQKHLKGETVTREELFAILDNGDVLEAQYIARAKESLERQAGAA
jgi:hypothetical protein